MSLDEMMNQFRLASREMFNHYFRVLQPYENDGWMLEERFGEVEELLFQKLVAEPASIKPVTYGHIQSDIGVELRSGEFAPIMLNREIDSGYWDSPLEEITKDAKLFFLSFFDWDNLDYHDNRYVRVQVGDWPSHPEAIGKHALIESQYVKFVIIQGAATIAT